MIRPFPERGSLGEREGLGGDAERTWDKNEGRRSKLGKQFCFNYDPPSSPSHSDFQLFILWPLSLLPKLLFVQSSGHQHSVWVLFDCETKSFLLHHSFREPLSEIKEHRLRGNSLSWSHSLEPVELSPQKDKL